MWDMSKAGSDAEECFLRQPQTQYYRDATADVHMFEKMPNVSSSQSEIHIKIKPLLFASVSTSTRK